MNIRVGNKILQSGQKGVLFQSLRAAVLRPFEFRVKAENQTSLNRGPHATFNTADLDLYPSITTLNKVPTSRKWKKQFKADLLPPQVACDLFLFILFYFLAFLSHFMILNATIYFARQCHVIAMSFYFCYFDSWIAKFCWLSVLHLELI